MAIISLWVMGRMFKGISIIFDVYPAKIYLGGFLFIAICLIAIYGYLDYSQSATMYLKFLLRGSEVIMQ
jgi:hypothetical protein